MSYVKDFLDRNPDVKESVALPTLIGAIYGAAFYPYGGNIPTPTLINIQGILRDWAKHFPNQLIDDMIADYDRRRREK